MSEILITRDYPHPPGKAWRAVTDPELVPFWTATAAGERRKPSPPKLDAGFDSSENHFPAASGAFF